MNAKHNQRCFQRAFTLPGEAISQPDEALQDVAEAFFYDAFSSMRVKLDVVVRVPAALIPQIFWSLPGQAAQ